MRNRINVLFFKSPLTIIWLIIFSSLPDCRYVWHLSVWFQETFFVQFCIWSFQLNVCLPVSTSVAFLQAIVVSQTAITGRGAYSVIREWGEREGKGTNGDLWRYLWVRTHVCAAIYIGFFPTLEKLLIPITKFDGGLQILCSEKYS